MTDLDLTGSSLEVAPRLLGAHLTVRDDEGVVTVRLTEVEAYDGAGDPGSHAYRGRTPRTEVMFGPPGRLYVYFTYGMHWCANVVATEPGVAGAVLLRAIAPLRGIEAMRAARPAARREVDLGNGPAKLCQALGIGAGFDGADLVSADRGVAVLDDGTAPPVRPVTGPRVGISVATELPWRFSVPHEPHRSRPW